MSGLEETGETKQKPFQVDLANTLQIPGGAAAILTPNGRSIVEVGFVPTSISNFQGALPCIDIGFCMDVEDILKLGQTQLAGAIPVGYYKWWFAIAPEKDTAGNRTIGLYIQCFRSLGSAGIPKSELEQRATQFNARIGVTTSRGPGKPGFKIEKEISGFLDRHDEAGFRWGFPSCVKMADLGRKGTRTSAKFDVNFQFKEALKSAWFYR